jgi:hypothetical protein
MLEPSHLHRLIRQELGRVHCCGNATRILSKRVHGPNPNRKLDVMLRGCLAAWLLCSLTSCSFRQLDEPSRSDSGAGGGSAASSGGGAGGATSGGGGGDVGGSSGSSCTGCGAASCACLAGEDSEWTSAIYATGDVPCPEGYQLLFKGGDNAIDTGCGPCTCDPPTGAHCFAQGFYDTACTQTGNGSSFQVQQCNFVSSSSAIKGATVTSPGCGSAHVAPATPKFQTDYTVCGTAQPPPVCASGGRCVAPAQAPFEPKSCVAWSGQGPHGCPAGYKEMHFFYVDVDDQRTCSGCTCEQTGCKGGAFHWCTGSSCNSCSSPMPGEACYAGQAVGVLVDSLPSEPDCQPSGTAVVSGTVKETTYRTVCCT